MNWSWIWGSWIWNLVDFKEFEDEAEVEKVKAEFEEVEVEDKVESEFEEVEDVEVQ